jgi:hypothetical protein
MSTRRIWGSSGAQFREVLFSILAVVSRRAKLSELYHFAAPFETGMPLSMTPIVTACG